MATRIIAIPDANGLIRIACGGDILEIEVQAASQPANGDPFLNPFTPVHIPNPFDTPGAYINLQHGQDGKPDIDRLVASARDQIADGSRPDPAGVILNVETANLHDITRAAAQIARVLPQLFLAIDFGKLRKP